MTQTMPEADRTSSRVSIRQLLYQLGAASEASTELLSTRTRDNEKLDVFRDKMTGVIFIDNFYIGDKEYITGDYRSRPKPLMEAIGRAYEDLMDSERRFDSFRQFIAGKSIVDIGCGAGSFLKLSKSIAGSAVGVELQQDFRDALQGEGIDCQSDLLSVRAEQDCCFLFHCLEHLPDPISMLENVRSKLKSDGRGKVVIEVPHARDFLIDRLKIQEFIAFTLWSQHLILHTRHSLELLLKAAGFKNIQIQGVQRYSLSNHLCWLKSQRPGGHKSILSAFETRRLSEAYADALAGIDATDTLVAVGET